MNKKTMAESERFRLSRYVRTSKDAQRNAFQRFFISSSFNLLQSASIGGLACLYSFARIRVHLRIKTTLARGER
ncbi:hypothetical protein [Salinisphaera japonica]|uniref:hypothetical protein n=1 Tax=Salinisphaera japonica TaxID=1304270 RepID=UPI000F4C5F2F|nr:hypothetical protein [Salinisphaera japonica]